MHYPAAGLHNYIVSCEIASLLHAVSGGLYAARQCPALCHSVICNCACHSGCSDGTVLSEEMGVQCIEDCVGSVEESLSSGSKDAAETSADDIIILLA